MAEQNLLEQLKEIAKDEDFMAKLVESLDYKEFASSLATKGLELTDDEAKQLFDGMKNGVGELPEESLDDVSGGSGTVGLIVCGALFLCGFVRGCRKKC